MIPVWPADLPDRALADTFNLALEDGRLRTPMDAGPPKSRLRFSAAPRPVQVSFKLTPDQRGRLDRFWGEDTRGGTLPFLIRDQIDDDRPMLATLADGLLDHGGQPLLVSAYWLAVFGDGPPAFTTRDRGLSFVAAFSLSVLPT